MIHWRSSRESMNSFTIFVWIGTQVRRWKPYHRSWLAPFFVCAVTPVREKLGKESQTVVVKRTSMGRTNSADSMRMPKWPSLSAAAAARQPRSLNRIKKARTHSSQARW